MQNAVPFKFPANSGKFLFIPCQFRKIHFQLNTDLPRIFSTFCRLLTAIPYFAKHTSFVYFPRSIQNSRKCSNISLFDIGIHCELHNLQTNKNQFATQLTVFCLFPLSPFVPMDAFALHSNTNQYSLYVFFFHCSPFALNVAIVVLVVLTKGVIIL